MAQSRFVLNLDEKGVAPMPGFIPGSRGSLMLDIVAGAMLAILPLLIFAIKLAKTRRAFTLHKYFMIGISVILLLAVLLFEVEMRLLGWKHLAQASPFFSTLVPITLVVHLIFSVSTSLTLGLTIFFAIRQFPNPPAPGQHSALHRRLGKISAWGLGLTSMTGWLFYYLAFIAD